MFPKLWSVESFEGLKKVIAGEVPEGDKRRDAVERIEHGLDPTKALVGEEDMAKSGRLRHATLPPQNSTKARRQRLAGYGLRFRRGALRAS